MYKAEYAKEISEKACKIALDSVNKLIFNASSDGKTSIRLGPGTFGGVLVGLEKLGYSITRIVSASDGVSYRISWGANMLHTVE